MLDVANRRDGRDDLPRAHIRLGSEQRVESRENQRERERRPAADHLLGEEVHRPVLDAARDANLGRRRLHLGRDVIRVQGDGEADSVHHSLGAKGPLRVTAAARLLDPAPLDEREDDVLVGRREGEREVLHDETREPHLVLQAVIGLARALDGAPGDVVQGEVEVEELASPLLVGGVGETRAAELVPRVDARGEELDGVAAAVLRDPRVVERGADAAETLVCRLDALDEVRAGVNGL